MSTAKYKRVLIKISGEALAGGKGSGLDFEVLSRLSGVIKKCVDIGVQVGIVVGGGNIWRGVKDGAGKIDRARSDHMGMLGTAINALALADVLEQHDLDVRVQTAIEMSAFAEPYIRLKAISHLNKGRVVVFGCGTGSPYMSTDTAAVLRAVEINAEIILFAKNIDGVYDSDPAKNPEAKRYDRITFDEILEKHLGVMDSTAASMANDNNMPMLVFGVKTPETILEAIKGEKVGTLVVSSR
ncbi:MAG: UMP kinase [Clostridiales bacterium]|nr:UMP kinase [Clostridiales bacterium]